MACGARLGDARGEGRRFDRSEGQCTPLLSPIAAYHVATIYAAETCLRANQSPIPMDCCKMLLAGARFSGHYRDLQSNVLDSESSHGHRIFNTTPTPSALV